MALSLGIHHSGRPPVAVLAPDGVAPSPGAPANAILVDQPSSMRRIPVVNLSLMGGEALETHLAGLFARRGYAVRSSPSCGEIGAALLVTRGPEGIVVQVKRWNAALGEEVIQHLQDALRYHVDTLRGLGCTNIHGMIISTWYFTPGARELATANGIVLWDRQELERQIQA
ncbi:MAG: restriction endonuclease [Candidatus Dormibacteria bacterium]